MPHVRVNEATKKKINRISRGLGKSMVDTVEFLCNEILKEPLKVRLIWSPTLTKLTLDDFPEIPRGLERIEKYDDKEKDAIYVATFMPNNCSNAWIMASIQKMVESIELRIARNYAIPMSRLTIYGQRWFRDKSKERMAYLMFTYVPKTAKIVGLKHKRCKNCKKQYDVIATIGRPNGMDCDYQGKNFCTMCCKRDWIKLNKQPK